MNIRQCLAGRGLCAGILFASALASSAATLAGSELSWALNTSDTRLTLSVIANQPAITRLEDPHSAHTWNWVADPAMLPLLDRVAIGSTVYRPNWTLTHSSQSAAGGTTVTLTFESSQPALTLVQIWRAELGGGPVEETSTITNRSRQTITLEDSSVVATDLTVAPSGAATLWQFSRSAVADHSAAFARGVLQTPLNPGVAITAVMQNDDHTTALPSPQYAHGGSYVLPFELIHVAGPHEHGLYLGYESDFGQIATSVEKGQIRNRITLWNDHHFSIGPGARPLPLPGMFYGTYTGTPDEGSNQMKAWFWAHRITPTLRDHADEPLVETCINGDTEAQAIQFFADNPQLAAWGVELAKEDWSWTDDASDQSHGSFGWNWNPAPAGWPHGLTLGDIVHRQGLQLSLYMANTYRNLDLAGGGWGAAPSHGVTAERNAVESRYLGTAANFVRPQHGSVFDYWRTDIDFEAPLDYLGHLGFLEVIDYMIGKYPQFRWENCSGGGSKKSFEFLQRQTVMTTEDSGGSSDSAEHFRMAYYANCYMINPVQLKADNGPFEPGTPDSVAISRYSFRLGFLGAWMWTVFPGTDFYRQPAEYAAHIGLYRSRQRPILRGADVYHVLPICDGTHWDGIEFFNPRLDRGSVILFKPKSAVGDSPAKIPLSGLKPDQTYTLTFQDRAALNFPRSNRYHQIRGSALMRDGISSFSGAANDWDSEIIWISADTAAQD